MEEKKLFFDCNHFYVSDSNLTGDYKTAFEECMKGIQRAFFPSAPPVETVSTLDLAPTSTTTGLDYDPDLCQDHHENNYSLPVSDWDGLLAVELSLRKNSDDTVLDLTSCCGRSALSEAVSNMPFLDPHDAHYISTSLDEYIDGPLPSVPKLSLLEVAAACRLSDYTLLDTRNGVTNTVVPGSTDRVIQYDSGNNQYTISSSKSPTSPLMTGLLKACFWNANSWNRLKALKIAELANSSDLDVICVTDARIDSWRAQAAVNSFAAILNNTISKVWKGLVSPKHGKYSVRGDIVMYSKIIVKPNIEHIIPCGVLTELTCRWGGS
jgi:hypothetical protein